MKFGLIEFPVNNGSKTDSELYSNFLERVRLAEDLGFDSTWFTEHHFFYDAPIRGSLGLPSIAVQAATAAAITKRMRIGSAVVVLPLHHPVLVAEDFATIDLISGGRLEFGIGRGNTLGGGHHFEGLGISEDDIYTKYDECLQVILDCWTKNKFSFSGKYYKYPEIQVIPKPLQKPHPPIWQPVISPDGMKRLAMRGINPILGTTLTTLDDLYQKYFLPWQNIVRELGRDPVTSQNAHSQWVYVAETNREAEEDVKGIVGTYIRERKNFFPESNDMFQFYSKLEKLSWEELVNTRLIIGDPDSVIEKLKFLDQKCDCKQLLAVFGFAELPQAKAVKSMKLFAREVMPPFSRDKLPTPTNMVTL